jgi:glycosyltransferase involved in cell wall biosynthesis
MSKIKVLHIVKSLGRGGAEILLLETLKQHDKNQFEFYYIYFLPWKNQLVNELEINGANVFNFKSKNNFQIILRTISIIKFSKKNDIKIIHCHLPWAGIVGRLVGQITKIPVVYSEHNKQERYHPLTKLINKFTYNWQQLVLAVSKDVELSIQKNIHPTVNVKVVFNGVDTDYFIQNIEERKKLRTALNIDENTILVGNVCVFRKQKRLQIWVDVFEKVNQKHSNTYGILIGAGILFDEIRAYIEKKKLKDKILLLGLQTNVKKYLNIMDVFVSTSEFEGLPIALLEAMSMQCSVAVTNAGGVKEVIENGKNGFCVSVESAKNLVNPISQLIEDVELRKIISNNARQLIVNKFSVSETTKQIEQYYYELIN